MASSPLSLGSGDFCNARNGQSAQHNVQYDLFVDRILVGIGPPNGSQIAIEK
jgi:hypothetical protein